MNENQICIYVCDTETTGLNFQKHDIIELSLLRLIPKKDSFEEEQKTWLIKAVNPQTIEDKALQVNGHKREDILHISNFGKSNYRLPQDVVDEADAWIMEDGFSSIDRIFAGQNPRFDLEFLQELWKRCGRLTEEDFPFYVHHGNRILDTTMITVFIDFCVGRRRRYYNLGNLIKSFGVKKEKFHRADADVRITAELLKKFVKVLGPAAIENFKDCYNDDD